MTAVCGILPAGHIFARAEFRSKKRVFEQACLVFENSGGIPRDKIFSALMRRERLGSTFIGNGGAVPHGRLEGAERPMAALVLLKKPIQYGIGEDGGEARTLFFLIAPEDAADEHLRLLGRFSEMLSDAPLVGELHGCADGVSAAAALARWEAKRGETQ